MWLSVLPPSGTSSADGADRCNGYIRSTAIKELETQPELCRVLKELALYDQDFHLLENFKAAGRISKELAIKVGKALGDGIVDNQASDPEY